jgi:23S rRNA (pseudouridine1915-N3)-methyltransferase
MTIELIAIGKTDSKELQRLIAIYTKRLGRYIKFELQLIPDIKNSKNLSEFEQKRREGEVIIKRLEPTDVVVLLDENGRTFSSVEFADYLQKQMNTGIKKLVFVIGGPYGFSEELFARAKERLSLSKMTFSHQMVRLFFIEQIYRGFTILRNEPYHHR